MKKIIYYVAASIDGFIMGFDENMGDFVAGGAGVEKYLDDLKEFATVIMGRKTYEFGYKFGLQPGEAPYPWMKNYIFSNTFRLEEPHENVQICPLDPAFIDNIKNESQTDIYLCGGGEFAGWLLDNRQIDILKIKLNPLILGSGIRLFGTSTRKLKTELISSQIYDRGLQIIEYSVI